MKLSELERKYDIQVARHEQLSREMHQLRQLAPPPCAGGGTSGSGLARCAGTTTSVAGAGGGQCRSPFRVFVARYSYDPVLYSPNDNPEAELTLNAGDYLFIYGDLDEVSYHLTSPHTAPPPVAAAALGMRLASNFVNAYIYRLLNVYMNMAVKLGPV